MNAGPVKQSHLFRNDYDAPSRDRRRQRSAGVVKVKTEARHAGGSDRTFQTRERKRQVRYVQHRVPLQIPVAIDKNALRAQRKRDEYVQVRLFPRRGWGGLPNCPSPRPPLPHASLRAPWGKRAFVALSNCGNETLCNPKKFESHVACAVECGKDLRRVGESAD